MSSNNPLLHGARRLLRRMALSVGPIRRLHAERGALRKRTQELQRELAVLRAGTAPPSPARIAVRAEAVPELDFLGVTPADVLRWDREWCRYLSRVDGARYFTGKTKYTPAELARARRLREFPREKLYTSRGPLSDLHIWYDGADLADKKVAEIGCGPSQLGRDLSPIVAEYIGLDYSDLALSIARLTCADNCRFFNLLDKAQIVTLRGTRDTIVSRHFFIHQNLANARWVLRLANFLLREGGLIVADFYWPDANHDEGVRRGSIRPAAEPLRDFASTMWEYSEAQIHEVVQEAGFRIEAEHVANDLPRRFVRLVKTRDASGSPA